MGSGMLAGGDGGDRGDRGDGLLRTGLKVIFAPMHDPYFQGIVAEGVGQRRFNLKITSLGERI